SANAAFFFEDDFDEDAWSNEVKADVRAVLDSPLPRAREAVAAVIEKTYRPRLDNSAALRSLFAILPCPNLEAMTLAMPACYIFDWNSFLKDTLFHPRALIARLLHSFAPRFLALLDTVELT